MSIEAITLHRFCTFDGGKYGRPMRLLGGTAATNRGLLIWVPTPYDYDRPWKEEVEANMSRWVRSAQEAAAAGTGTWRNATDLRLRESDCGSCNGRGHVNTRKCNDCGGDGSFERGRWTYDCKECDGSGEIIQPATSAHPACGACFGTGLNADVTDFRVAGQATLTANQRMVALLRELPKAQLREEPLQDADLGNMLAIRFDGGVGVLMPMKGAPLKPAQAATAEGGAA